MGKVRDFSMETVESIREDVNKCASACDEINSVLASSWSLGGNLLMNVVFPQQEEFDKILYRVHSVDCNYAGRFNALCERAVALQSRITSVASMISPEALTMNNDEYKKLGDNISDLYEKSKDKYTNEILYYYSQLPRLDDPNAYEKIYNTVKGTCVSIFLDGMEGIISGMMLYGTAFHRDTSALKLIKEQIDDIEDCILRDKSIVKEYFYIGMVGGDIISMIGGVMFLKDSLPSIGGMFGGTCLSLKVAGIGGTVDINEVIEKVAEGVVSVPVAAVGAGLMYSGFNNLIDHYNKIKGFGDEEVKQPNAETIEKPKMSEDIDNAANEVKNKVGGGSGLNSNINPARVADEVLDGDLLKSANVMKDKLPTWAKNKGNFGYSEVDIDGLDKTQFFAHSSIQTEIPSVKDSGISIKPESSPFKTLEVNGNNVINGEGAWPRDVDIEYKILSDIQSKLGDNYSASGKIKLYTELVPCPSCQSVIKQFKEMYPNIDIEVIYSIEK